jgi:putative flippase GtrA
VSRRSTPYTCGMHLPRLRRTVVRFATVGVANTVIDVVLFWVLQAPLGILAANFASTSAGMVFSFLVNGRHTFGASRLTGQQALGFLATNGFTMWLLQPAVIGLAHGLAGTPLLATKALALGASVVVNFLLYRYVVWRRPAPRISPTPAPAGLDAAPEAARR